MSMRQKWITAALAAAAGGLWAAVLAAPAVGMPRDPEADCRSLGTAALILLGFRLTAGPRLRKIEARQAAAETTWREYQEARAEREAGLGLAGGRSA